MLAMMTLAARMLNNRDPGGMPMINRQNPEQNASGMMESPERPGQSRCVHHGTWTPIDSVEIIGANMGKGQQRYELNVVILYRDMAAWPPAYMVRHGDATQTFYGMTALADADLYAHDHYGVHIATASVRMDLIMAGFDHREGQTHPRCSQRLIRKSDLTTEWS